MSSLSSAAVPVRPAGPPMRVSHLGDELLARQASHGSERAFTALYERYHQQLYRYCRSILRNDADSQDALQSTFTGALQALRRNQRNAPLRPWLYRIAHNEAISLLRRRTRTAADELDADSLGVGASVEQEAADRARWQSLVEDLGGLPDRQRGALLLRELSGLSHEEIGIALGTSTAGAKQAIFEARQALAELEEGRAMSCDEVRRRVSEGDRRMLRGRRVKAHLHACSACEAFAFAIPERRNQLMAFAPVLAPSAAAAVLSRSMHAASTQGGAGGASAAAGAGAATKTLSTAVLWKGLATVAVIATAAAGATGIRHLLTPSRTSARASSTQLGHAGSRDASKAHSAVTAKHKRGASALAARTRHANRRAYAAADRGASASHAGGSRHGADAVSGRTTTQPATGPGPAQGATAAGGPANGTGQGGGGSQGQQGGGGGGGTQGQQGGGGTQGQQGGGGSGGTQGQQGGGGGGGSQGQEGGGGGGGSQGQQGGSGGAQGQQGGSGGAQGQQGGGGTQGQQSGGGSQGQQGGGGTQGQQSGGGSQGQQGGGSQGGSTSGGQGSTGAQGQQGGN